MSDVEGPSDGSVDLVERLKGEIKELRNQIVVVKKSVTKGDKKAKKAVESQVIELEASLKAKQDELEAAKNAPQANEPTEDDVIEKARMKRQSKRERKAANVTASVEAAKAGLYKGPNHGAIEEQRLHEILRRESLVIYQMDPDGHCLFNAIAHQMEVLFGQEMDYREVRRLAAERIAKEGELYSAFLDFDEDASEEVAGQKGIDAYCHRVRETTLWGGHIELDALSKVLQRPIMVYQSDSDPLRFGEFTPDQQPLRLCFQKYAYSLGEHYDSLVPFEIAQKLNHPDTIPIKDDQDDEDYLDGH